MNTQINSYSNKKYSVLNTKPKTGARKTQKDGHTPSPTFKKKYNPNRKTDFTIANNRASRNLSNNNNILKNNIKNTSASKKLQSNTKRNSVSPAPYKFKTQQPQQKSNQKMIQTNKSINVIQQTQQQQQFNVLQQIHINKQEIQSASPINGQKQQQINQENKIDLTQSQQKKQEVRQIQSLVKKVGKDQLSAMSPLKTLETIKFSNYREKRSEQKENQQFSGDKNSQKKFQFKFENNPQMKQLFQPKFQQNNAIEQQQSKQKQQNKMQEEVQEQVEEEEKVDIIPNQNQQHNNQPKTSLNSIQSEDTEFLSFKSTENNSPSRMQEEQEQSQQQQQEKSYKKLEQKQQNIHSNKSQKKPIGDIQSLLTVGQREKEMMMDKWKKEEEVNKLKLELYTYKQQIDTCIKEKKVLKQQLEQQQQQQQEQQNQEMQQQQQIQSNEQLEKQQKEIERLTIQNDIILTYLTKKEEQILEANSKFSSMQNQLEQAEIIRTQMHEQIIKIRGNLQIYCRVKPLQNVDSMALSLVYKMNKTGEKEAQLIRQKSLHQSPYQQQQQLQSQSSSNSKQKQMNKNYYYFDHVFDQETSQEQVFDKISPFVQSAIDGQDCSIIAYGQTGSGKTYTLEGRQMNNTKVLNDIECGIIPRTALQFLQEMKRLQTLSKYTFSIHLSAIEIYNDSITDLFSKETNLKILNTYNQDAKVVIENQTFIEIQSGEQMIELLQQASQNRQQESTNANQHSSRSHSIYQINIVYNDPSKKNGTLKIVDLAGSERFDDHNQQPTHQQQQYKQYNIFQNQNQQNSQNIQQLLFNQNTVPSRQSKQQDNRLSNNNIINQQQIELKNKKLQTEANYINKSLTTLGRVIRMVSENRYESRNSSMIPYRESKLTRLIQDCIGGNAKTVLIITVCPSEDNQFQTKESLKFASKTML